LVHNTEVFLLARLADVDAALEEGAIANSYTPRSHIPCQRSLTANPAEVFFILALLGIARRTEAMGEDLLVSASFLTVPRDWMDEFLHHFRYCYKLAAVELVNNDCPHWTQTDEICLW